MREQFVNLPNPFFKEGNQRPHFGIKKLKMSWTSNSSSFSKHEIHLSLHDSQPPFFSGFGKPQTSSILRISSSVLMAVSQSATFRGLPIFLMCAPNSDSG
jgi:hypothetical protein